MVTIWALLIFIPAVLACVAASAERRTQPVATWRLLTTPLLVGLSTVILLYLPPSNNLGDLQVWMLALVAGVAGVARGAMVRLSADHGQRLLLLRRAPEGVWIALAAALLVLAEIAADPFGPLGSRYILTIEMILSLLWSFLLCRNVTLLARSGDAPHRDL